MVVAGDVYDGFFFFFFFFFWGGGGLLSFFSRDVWDEILDLTESVSEGVPTYSSRMQTT